MTDFYVYHTDCDKINSWLENRNSPYIKYREELAYGELVYLYGAYNSEYELLKSEFSTELTFALNKVNKFSELMSMIRGSLQTASLEDVVYENLRNMQKYNHEIVSKLYDIDDVNSPEGFKKFLRVYLAIANELEDENDE